MNTMAMLFCLFCTLYSRLTILRVLILCVFSVSETCWW